MQFPLRHFSLPTAGSMLCDSRPPPHRCTVVVKLYFSSTMPCPSLCQDFPQANRSWQVLLTTGLTHTHTTHTPTHIHTQTGILSEMRNHIWWWMIFIIDRHGVVTKRCRSKLSTVVSSLQPSNYVQRVVRFSKLTWRVAGSAS